MKTQRLLRALVESIAFAGLSGPVIADTAVPWTYPEIVDGANIWATTNGYTTCGEAATQSPIAVTRSGAARSGATVSLAPSTMKIDVVRGPPSSERSHHNFEFKIPAGYTVTVSDKNTGNRTIWTLSEFHFHVPAEHNNTGLVLPMDLHIKAMNGTVPGVFGVRFTLQKGNTAFLAPILESVTGNPPTSQFDLGFALERFKSRPFYSYPGSLTTPPCTTGVTWYVLEPPIEIAPLDLDTFVNALNRKFSLKKNSRFPPEKPLSGRRLIIYNAD